MSIEQVNSVLKQITDTYDEQEIATCMDDAIPGYVDDDWDESGDFDSEYDWYTECGGGEAEDQVIDSLLEEFKVPDELIHDVAQAIKEEYMFLDY